MSGSHKRIGGPLVALVATTAALAAAGPAQAAGNPAPGTYKGGVKGGSVVLKVKPGKQARLSYALKSKCGRARGSVSLKLKHGRFHSAGRSRTADAASGRFVGGGAKAKGVIDRLATNRRARGEACKLARHFTAKLSRASQAGSGSSLESSDYGHYSGANAAGRPVSFDVVDSATGPVIANFAVDVDTECWDDYNGDGADDTLLVHIAGFGGKIADDGSFDIYYAPDDDTEFEFDGTIADGETAVDVVAGGHFNSDGTPNMTGSYECDSWGDTYSAAL